MRMNINKLVLVVSLLISVFIGFAESAVRMPSCHQIEFDNCLKRNFFAIGRREDVSMLVTTETGFDQLCRRFNESLSCIEQHLARCAPPLYGILFKIGTEQMQAHFRSYICNTTNPQRQEYFKHAECYREHVFATDKAMPCLNNYLLAFEHIERTLSTLITTTTSSSSSSSNKTSIEGSSIMTWRSIICCAHERKRECTRTLAGKHCGPKAPEPFDRFFEQIHFGFFEILCTTGPIMNPNSAECHDHTMPNWSRQPKGLQSHSAVSRLLVTYFPFNYVSLEQRTRIHKLYRKLKLQELSNTGGGGNA